MTKLLAAEALSAASEALIKADRVLILVGASVSNSASLMPGRTRTGPGRIHVETGSALALHKENPSDFQNRWRARRRHCSKFRQTEDLLALRELQLIKRATIVTQRVDGALSRAGCAEVLELRGSLMRSYRPRCGRTAVANLFNRCGKCFLRARPDVVFSCEMLDPYLVRMAESAAAECDLVLVIGQDACEEPAGSLIATSLKHGASLLVLEADATTLSQAADVSIAESADMTLPQLVEAVQVSIAAERILKKLAARYLSPGKPNTHPSLY